jgi:UDP-2,3-diacylglucosamine hydrolase
MSFAQIASIHVPAGKKIYFASDFHLGIPDAATSLQREKLICRWLEECSKDAHHIFLLGDLFDAWLEGNKVVPKGFTRFLGKLATMVDNGIGITAFTGNHDLWMRDYFQSELGLPVHHQPIVRSYNQKEFYIGHGDGLGPGDKGYKFLKKIMTNKILQWLYRRIHPDTGIAIANWFSQLGPKHGDGREEEFQGAEKEWLVQFCKSTIEKNHFDYFIFGHRHLALEYPISERSLYINLGDWIRFDSYAVFDGTNTRLQYYKKHD